jgi:hypothetical protein
MSRKVLLKEGPNTYLDDLESFYYVFCSIVVGYMSPGAPRVPLPAIVKGWAEDYAWPMKHGHIVKPFDLPVSEWFGGAIRKLCVQLHSFFHTRDWATALAIHEGRDPPHPTPTIDYDEFLSHIRKLFCE